MTRTEELLALAEAATPWLNRTQTQVCDLADGNGAVLTINPETIKQLVELCRLQHEALKMLDYGTRFDEATEAIAAFNRFEKGGE